MHSGDPDVEFVMLVELHGCDRFCLDDYDEDDTEDDPLVVHEGKADAAAQDMAALPSAIEPSSAGESETAAQVSEDLNDLLMADGSLRSSSQQHIL